jgi:hypothetical protein
MGSESIRQEDDKSLPPPFSQRKELLPFVKGGKEGFDFWVCAVMD